MIDLILLTFVVGVFAAGFWLGGKFKTYGAMWAEVKAKF